MAYVPTNPHGHIANVHGPQLGRVQSLSSPIAVPVGLPAPSASMRFSSADLEAPPASKLPLIILAIACALSGALAALVLV